MAPLYCVRENAQLERDSIHIAGREREREKFALANPLNGSSKVNIIVLGAIHLGHKSGAKKFCAHGTRERKRDRSLL